MLRVEGLCKSYNHVQVLRGVTFEVEDGQVFGFLGPNGAGKTTTMNILAGLIGFDSGSITIDGVDAVADRSRLRGLTGYLPENPSFYGYMSAREYLLFTGEIAGFRPQDNRDRCEELLRVTGLAATGRKPCGSFSRGMKQRLGIAVALYNRPKLLFLDEPTSALDPGGRLEVLELIGKLREEGMTIFLSTHILNDVERTCDSVSIIKDGRILVTDRLENLRSRYIQPIIDVGFDRRLDGPPEEIETLPWVQKVTVEGDRAAIYVSDLESAKRGLLPRLASLEASVTSYQLRQANLEDIFVRLVRE
ncbi:MAG: ABC transporter ATP-binding protein [Firmicutes bacterium]|jgi:ABC-2 type transport system ATP-binding protein|nr:ABC transporter ATP-binding protein [Bacillota bacterium]